MEEPKIRKPAVAGQFYSSSASGLRKQIDSLIDKNAVKRDVIACMLPHAGYMYSGRVAAETVSRINLKSKIILLGPNHTGSGAPFAIMTEGVWQTPLGEIRIDKDLARKILAGSRYLEDDSLAHAHEHSLEVELPFLQFFKSGFQIVPIAFLSDDIAALKETGRQIAAVINESGDKNACLIVASSDMTHYEPQESAEKKDHAAIQAILELNEDKLAKEIKDLRISMCGYAPVIVMLSAAKALGAAHATLVKYETSGNTTQDTSSVVGYAGITVY